jgi:hypothetical protein
MKLTVAITYLGCFALLGLGCAHDAAVRSGGAVTLVDEAPEDDQFVIPRSTVEHALELGPAWFVRQLSVRPIVTRDERFFGFQLMALFPGREDISQLPIRTGDIIQRVNGQSIERPEQFMSIWHSLATASHVSVQLMRGNQSLLVTWVIQDRAPGSDVSVTTR